MRVARVLRVLATVIFTFVFLSAGLRARAQQQDQGDRRDRRDRRFRVLHNFQGGLDPLGVEGLAVDSNGTLYGESILGGPLICFTDLGFCEDAGARFKLDRHGVYSLLPSPTGSDNPIGGSAGPVLLDNEGNLVFAADVGGADGHGGVFSQNPRTGDVAPLFSFSDFPVDGATPLTGVIRDAAGNLYGATLGGGHNPSGACAIGDLTGGCGTIYKLDAKTHQETVLHTFDFDAGWEGWGLARDGAGNLFGSTPRGGDTPCREGPEPIGCGLVFRIDSSGNFSVIHRFSHRPTCPFISCPPSPPGAEVHGVGPSYLTVDEEGTVFGVTQLGGNFGLGVIFKIDTAGKYTVLHHFAGPFDGFNTQALALRDGKLYGVNFEGGNILDCGFGSGCGTIFVVDTKTGKFSVLHTFSRIEEGAGPTALAFDEKGDVFGATFFGAAGVGDPNRCTGGEGCGNVFKFRLRDRDDDDE